MGNKQGVNARNGALTDGKFDLVEAYQYGHFSSPMRVHEYFNNIAVDVDLDGFPVKVLKEAQFKALYRDLAAKRFFGKTLFELFDSGDSTQGDGYIQAPEFEYGVRIFSPLPRHQKDKISGCFNFLHNIYRQDIVEDVAKLDTDTLEKFLNTVYPKIEEKQRQVKIQNALSQIPIYAANKIDTELKQSEFAKWVKGMRLHSYIFDYLSLIDTPAYPDLIPRSRSPTLSGRGSRINSGPNSPVIVHNSPGHRRRLSGRVKGSFNSGDASNGDELVSPDMIETDLVPDGEGGDWEPPMIQPEDMIREKKVYEQLLRTYDNRLENELRPLIPLDQYELVQAHENIIGAIQMEMEADCPNWLVENQWRLRWSQDQRDILEENQIKSQEACDQTLTQIKEILDAKIEEKEIMGIHEYLRQVEQLLEVNFYQPNLGPDKLDRLHDFYRSTFPLQLAQVAGGEPQSAKEVKELQRRQGELEMKTNSFKEACEEQLRTNRANQRQYKSVLEEKEHRIEELQNELKDIKEMLRIAEKKDYKELWQESSDRFSMQVTYLKKEVASLKKDLAIAHDVNVKCQEDASKNLQCCSCVML